MLKRFGYSLIVATVLMVGVGVVNTVLVGSAMAEEKKCEKCGHTSDECAKTHCKCPCQDKKGH